LLTVLGTVQIDNRTVNRHQATIWLYPHVPGTRTINDTTKPFPLALRKGIAVFPRDAVPPGPRLPLLGVAALLNNDLDFWLDPELRHVSVATRTWRRRMMRLLRRI
jgi:hypothetical protein